MDSTQPSSLSNPYSLLPPSSASSSYPQIQTTVPLPPLPLSGKKKRLDNQNVTPGSDNHQILETMLRTVRSPQEEKKSEELSLFGCSPTENSVLSSQEEVQNCEIDSAKDVKKWNSSSFSDDELLELTKKSPNVEEITIEPCLNITNILPLYNLAHLRILKITGAS